MTALERRVRRLEERSAPRMLTAMFMQTEILFGPLQAGERRVVDYQEEVPGLVQWQCRVTTAPEDSGRVQIVSDGYMARRLTSAAARSCKLPWDAGEGALAYIYSVAYADDH